MSIYDYQGNKLVADGNRFVSDALQRSGVLSHRGWYEAPENTLPAIEEAVEHGYTHVEVDLNWTSDNVCVLLHDNTINRTSNGTGTISNMTYAQVSQYDFGSWKSAQYTGTKIPKLTEVLQYARYKNIALQLDIASQSKNPTTANLQGMIDDIVSCGMLNSVTICCYPNRGEQLLALNPDLLLTMGLDTYTIDQVAEIVKNCAFFCLSRATNVYDENTAKTAHNKGWKIQTWTVDTAADVEDYILGGCDWVITNSVLPNDL